jgi:hypothetical protein
MQLLQALNLLNETCAIRHYSLKTQKSYSHWLRRYSAFLKDPKFKLLSPEEKLEAFLTRLALSGISASSQNQAFNALLFFYRDVLNLQLGPVDSLRAHRPASLRYCPDRAEVFQLLAAVTNVGGYPTRLIVHLLYACGLRVCGTPIGSGQSSGRAGSGRQPPGSLARTPGQEIPVCGSLRTLGLALPRPWDLPRPAQQDSRALALPRK